MCRGRPAALICIFNVLDAGGAEWVDFGSAGRFRGAGGGVYVERRESEAAKEEGAGEAAECCGHCVVRERRWVDMSGCLAG